MFKTNNIATLNDVKGKNNIEVEVNKNNKIEDFVEFRMKDENQSWIKSYIKIAELYALIFLLVGKKEQEELMPIRQTQVRFYEKQHHIKLKKDMKKGEMVIANCKVSIPVVMEEGLRGLIKKRTNNSSGGILIPKWI